MRTNAELDIEPLVKAKKELGLDVSIFIPHRGSLVDPSAREAFVEGIKKGVENAKRLDCKTINIMTGPELKGVPREVQHKNVVEGLKTLVPILEKAGVTGALEPLNQVNHAGYYLSYSKEAFEIIDEVGSPNIKVLFDCYHQQITEGNLISTITQNIDKIGYLHAAGNPGRNEINIGEINYPEIFKAVKATNYDGYFGLEYRPTKDVGESLREARKLCI
jgi:hydroxypyruvate isomerase